MRTQRVVLGLVAIASVGLLTAAPVRAHHSFDAEFDRTKPIKVQGNIVKVDWVNPHSWIHVAVKKPDGKVETWRFEGGGPASLTRRGFTKDFTKWGSGTEVIVEGYLHRGVPLRASGRVLQYPDGRTLFVGSSGIGAPRDGADPSDR